MIYIFYLDYIPQNKQRNMHGGNVYSKRCMKLLTEAKIPICIILPKGYKAMDDEENAIFTNKYVTLLERENIMDGFELEENSILFFPLLMGKYMNLLKKFKIKNPTIQIYITIHGLRLLDLKFDPYDKYYLSEKKYLAYDVVAPIIYFFKSVVYKRVMNKNLLYADKVFTVSNYSLKQIVSCTEPKYVKTFYCNSNLKYSSISIPEDRKNYILFVSGGRAEKNFLRSLGAFIKFKKEDDNEYYLYVTGIKKNQLENLKRYTGWEENIVKKWVVFFDYLEEEELTGLYKNCSFVLYPSKSEGFGLPAIDACFSGVPIVTAFGSAIPEVLESAAYYINPLNLESIYRGIKFMAYEDNRFSYKERIQKYQEVVKKRIQFSDKCFVEEFRL